MTDRTSDVEKRDTSALVLSDHYEDVLERLTVANGLVLCTDFDGTLAPITDDPDSSEITPRNDAALGALAERDRVAVAVVSGRQVDDVAARVGIETIAYAGNHGLELTRAGTTSTHPIAADRIEDIDALLADLTDRLEGIEGYVLENKGVSATIHYRGVPKEDVPDIEAAVETAFDAHGDGLHRSSGKEIVEVGPAIPWDKGRVIDLLADDSPQEWITAYLGDDTTDESAFRALGDRGISVFVGNEEAETAARYRVSDPEGVADFFEWLAAEGIEALASDESKSDRS